MHLQLEGGKEEYLETAKMSSILVLIHNFCALEFPCKIIRIKKPIDTINFTSGVECFLQCAGYQTDWLFIIHNRHARESCLMSNFRSFYLYVLFRLLDYWVCFRGDCRINLWRKIHPFGERDRKGYKNCMTQLYQSVSIQITSLIVSLRISG